MKNETQFGNKVLHSFEPFIKLRKLTVFKYRMKRRITSRQVEHKRYFIEIVLKIKGFRNDPYEAFKLYTEHTEVLRKEEKRFYDLMRTLKVFPGAVNTQRFGNNLHVYIDHIPAITVAMIKDKALDVKKELQTFRDDLNFVKRKYCK